MVLCMQLRGALGRIMYNWDANYIWGVPLKKRTASAIVNDWTTLNNILTSKGFKSNLFIFDNSPSA